MKIGAAIKHAKYGQVEVISVTAAMVTYRREDGTKVRERLPESRKWRVGGAISNRTTDGQRRNAKTGQRLNDGRYNLRRYPGEQDVQSRRKANGERLRDGDYTEPSIANPGNVIKCIVGGGVMGDELCHENEAPFPESLAEFFVRSFCPEGGTVLDPFSGSGTTAAVAERWGRNWIAIDVRESQVALMKKRIRRAERPLLGA